MRVSDFVGIIVALCAVVIVVATVNGNSAPPQDVRMLDTRITQIERRLYTMESHINRLEQASLSQRPSAQTGNVRDNELILVREQLQNLTLRVSETECGLLKLDERTEVPRKADRPVDPCRANPNAPLRLTSRP